MNSVPELILRSSEDRLALVGDRRRFRGAGCRGSRRADPRAPPGQGSVDRPTG